MRILAIPEDSIKWLLSGKYPSFRPLRQRDLGDWSLISICDRPEEAVVETPEHIVRLQQYGCTEVLKLFFEDVGCMYEDDTRLFTEEQGLQILEFLNRHKTEDTIVVQCHAGIARSGAIGVFATRYFHLDEGVFKRDNPHIYPNDFVYGTLAKLSGLTGQYTPWWLDVDVSSGDIFK